MTDLTEYVEVAARALRADEWPNGADFDVLTPLQQHNYRQAVTPVVAAVAPLIERDARAAALEEAADELELPGSGASGYYASEAVGGYCEAERHAEAWLRGRARATREGR